MRLPARTLVLALLALACGLAAAGPAGASDAGLRQLVADAGPVKERVERDVRSVGTPPTNSVAAAVRHLRRAARIHDRVTRTVGGLRDRFRAEAPQTSLADEGRSLVLDGLHDLRVASGRRAGAARTAAGRLSRARSEPAVRRAARAYERTVRASARRFDRGVARAERGARLLAIAR